MDVIKKNAVLNTLRKYLNDNKQLIINANKRDIKSCKNIDESMLDRLKISQEKIFGMIESIRKIEKLDDPEGVILSSYLHDNGMKIENKSVPFGKILIIYESRPDVTIEASVLAFKAGNKILLKGGKESRETNKLLVKFWQQALSDNGENKDYVIYLDFNREQTQKLIKTNSHNVDLIIPRGGENLIDFVKKNTNIPIIISGRGNNFLFVDKESNFEMAVKIIIDGKTRISVCNALDKILLHKDIPNLKEKLSFLVDELKMKQIKMLGNEHICDINKDVKLNQSEKIFKEEFLDYKVFISTVESSTKAISLINKYSGGHSATIITSNDNVAQGFQNQVDCAAVYHNASTRFTDGGQFGVGAEIAISTQKLHFRGPVGLNELVTNKWFICGNGQARD